jgi:hypothetical protein
MRIIIFFMAVFLSPLAFSDDIAFTTPEKHKPLKYVTQDVVAYL